MDYRDCIAWPGVGLGLRVMCSARSRGMMYMNDVDDVDDMDDMIDGL